MKDTGRQDRIRFSFEQNLGQMPELACASAGYNRHTNRFTDSARDLKVKPCLGAISVDTVQHDFTSTQLHSAGCPPNRLQTCFFTPALCKNFPAPGRKETGLE